MEKIDVFLKTAYLDQESIPNINRWISIFDKNIKYNIKLVIPNKLNDTAKSLFKTIKICNDINLNDKENFKFFTFCNSLTHNWIPTAIANLTCYKNANTDFFWNIDSDDTILTNESLDDFELLNTLEKIENLSIKNNYYAASLDFYRVFNINNNEWNDHWSFGITFIKNDFEYIVDRLKDLKITNRGFGINSDHVFDTIRRNNPNKIITIAPIGCILIHPAKSNKKVLYEYQKNKKRTFNNFIENHTPYETITTDYIVI